MTNQQIHFITFGAPENYHDAVNRLCNQAQEFNIFTSITGYTENDLKKDNIFWLKHENFIKQNKRGYGYWLWKPYLILKKLNEINDNDILLYLDAGCELNIGGKEYFTEKLIKLTNDKKIIGTSTDSNDLNFTKKDLIIFTNMENSPLLKQNHMQAGILMINKCDIIVKLIEEWYKIASDNYNLIDNTPSIIKNHEIFTEHRHDQSIFNMLVKKYNLINYDLEPTYWGHYNYHNNNNYKNALKYPIWSCRNKTKNSIKQNF
jgi:hypothetical protein